MTAQPQIVVPSEGFHNSDMELARGRLLRGNSYRDCSTVMVVPAIKPIPPKVVQSWLGLMPPMNQRFTRLFIENMEVADAYNHALRFIFDAPQLADWKYMLTVETDNLVPPDALLKLIEDIESGPYDAVGACYWTKGPGGMVMCYGDPAVMPKNFIPFLPPPDSVTPCNGLGMGCTLFRLDFLKRMPAPWFKTVQEFDRNVGARAYTQDLWHFEQAAKYGSRVACSTRVLVGHYDHAADLTW